MVIFVYTSLQPKQITKSRSLAYTGGPELFCATWVLKIFLYKIKREPSIIAVLESTEQNQFRDTFRPKKDAKSTGNGRSQDLTYDI